MGNKINCVSNTNSLKSIPKKCTKDKNMFKFIQGTYAVHNNRPSSFWIHLCVELFEIIKKLKTPSRI